MTEKIELLIESTGIAPVKKGKRWLVTLAVPGRGSSGEYPEEVLRDYGPLAFPAGTKSYFTHESRDPRDQVGKFEEGAFWNDEKGVLQGYLTPFPRFAQVLEEAGSDIEASIHVESVKDTRTNRVLRLNPNRANTVDLVGFGGLEGSRLEMLVESFAAAAAAGEDTGKETQNVEITKEMWDAQASKLDGLATTLSTFIQESKTELQGVADEAAVDAAVEARLEEALASIAEQEAAIDAADILTVQKESLKAAARKGNDVTADLATAVEFATEARKELKTQPNDASKLVRGTVVVATESLSSKEAPKTFNGPRGWSK